MNICLKKNVCILRILIFSSILLYDIYVIYLKQEKFNYSINELYNICSSYVISIRGDILLIDKVVDYERLLDYYNRQKYDYLNKEYNITYYLPDGIIIDESKLSWIEYLIILLIILLNIVGITLIYLLGKI